MLFGIWMLVATKIGLLALLVLVAHIALPDVVSTDVAAVAFVVVISLALVGGVLGIALTVFGYQFRCPFCSVPCPLAMEPPGKVGLVCENCGYVHVKRLPFSLRLHVDKDEDDRSDNAL